MDRKTAYQLTEVLARVLHYQDRADEPNAMTAEYAEVVKEFEKLPRRIIERYLNDAKFHAQVDRAVSMVIEVLEPTSQTDRDRANAIALECAQMSGAVRRSADSGKP